jgi:hypothetical protein
MILAGKSQKILKAEFLTRPSRAGLVLARMNEREIREGVRLLGEVI